MSVYIVSGSHSIIVRDFGLYDTGGSGYAFEAGPDGSMVHECY
jgi:hypothetical protein